MTGLWTSKERPVDADGDARISQIVGPRDGALLNVQYGGIDVCALDIFSLFAYV